MVKLVLRDKEYEVKPGMDLLSALRKAGIVPESVIATRDGDMILEDEVLKDGEVIKLIAVISGGSCRCEERLLRRRVPARVSNLRQNWEIASGWVSTPHLRWVQVYAAKSKSAATQPPALAMTGGHHEMS